jgi:putative intracellular protease/amidase
MLPVKSIGFVFIEKFADWEFGLLSASAVEWFGGKALALTPGGDSVTSMGGFRLMGDRGHPAEQNRDIDAVAVIGSKHWSAASAPDISGLLVSVRQRGGIVGGICAGTLALARAGLFKGRKHTSNGRQWILQELTSYSGADFYQDASRAVVDGGVVSAPGSAPAGFAATFLEALYPDQHDTIAQMRAVFASEHRTGS